MSIYQKVKTSTLYDIGDAVQEIKNTTETVKVKNLSTTIRELKGTASPDKVFAGEEFLGANGKEIGTFTIDSELSNLDTLLTNIETLIETKKD